MSYCSRCGVEVEDAVVNCPLCEAPIQHLEPLDTPRMWLHPEKDRTGKTFLTPLEVKNRVYLFLITLLVMASLILWAVDYQPDGRLTWSWIPTNILLASFLTLTAAFNLYRSFIKLTLGLMASAAYLLGTLNYLTEAQWFFPLGLPILLALQGIFTLGWITIKRVRTRGYNVFGFVLTSAGCFLILVDALINGYHGYWEITWSVITSFSLFPFALYFFFLHYGLHKVLDFSRTFHF